MIVSVVQSYQKRGIIDSVQHLILRKSVEKALQKILGIGKRHTCDEKNLGIIDFARKRALKRLLLKKDICTFSFPDTTYYLFLPIF